MTIRPTGLRALLAVTAVGLSSCRLVVGAAALGTAVAVGTVGLAGYTVYKSGEKVVTTVGSVGSSMKDKHKSVVVSRGTLKTKSSHSIEELYPAATEVLRAAGFTGVIGTSDSLSGTINARTAAGESVSVTFKLLEKALTAVEIRVGDGNLKQEEFLYDQMLAMVGDEDGGATR